MKKRWILVPIALTMLAIGIVTAGAALSHGTDTNGISSFASRVASILGLDEAQVRDAIDQARRELRDEAVQNKMSRLVEKGRITQEQADAYLEWYQSRPDDFPGFGLRDNGFGRHDHGLKGFWPQAHPVESPGSADHTAS